MHSSKHPNVCTALGTAQHILKSAGWLHSVKHSSVHSNISRKLYTAQNTLMSAQR